MIDACLTNMHMQKASCFLNYGVNKHITWSKKLLDKMKNIDNNYVVKDYRWKATSNSRKGTY